MAGKAKAPAKKAAKAPAKKAPATKAPATKAAVKPAKAAVKKPAPSAAKKAPAKAAPKSAPKAAPKAAPKPVSAPVKPAAAARGAAAKMPPKLPPPKASARPPSKPAARSVALDNPPALPASIPAPKLVQPKALPGSSDKDIAAAHEYLLTRSATRSNEPVYVNGRKLPSEGELLKMPDAAYMNEQQLAFFRHRLQQMERELLANADETTEHLRETVIVPDPADRATIEEEHALELRTRDRERKLLKKVQQAIARIDSGDYGYCEETGDPIGIPRLLARPTATLSLEAQQRREMKQKMYGD
jgi:DnaK suppressor protein